MAEPKVQVVWSNPEEKAVVLENATIVRPISLPDKWTRLKLGIRCAISGSSTSNITGTPRLYLGFCSGSNVIGDATTDFFVGFRSNTSTWTYTSGSTREYYTWSVGNMIVKLDNNITASGDVVTDSARMEFINGVFKPTTFNLLITRSLDESNTKYRIVGGYYEASTGFAGYTSPQFLEDMTSATNTGLSAAMTATTAYTTNPIGFRGGFDNVLVAWDKETPNNAMVIMDIAVAAFEE